jgi:hypothetical protein
MKEYPQTGGVRTGSFNATWPFAEIKAAEDHISISVFAKPYAFQKEDSLRMKKYKGDL